jgi:hypothetical protein
MHTHTPGDANHSKLDSFDPAAVSRVHAVKIP